MAEEASQKTQPDKPDRRQPNPRGIGADAGSGRREFRRFRAKPKPKDDISTSAAAGPPAAADNKKQRTRQPPFCRYFNTSKGCRTGVECPFRHVTMQKKVDNAEAAPSSSKNEDSVTVAANDSSSLPASEFAEIGFVPPNVLQRPTLPQKVILHKEDSGHPPQLSARKSELNYFKRRYRYSTITKESDCSDVVTFKYEVTDPEWLFDVKTMTFSFRMLDVHPIQPPTFAVPPDANRVLPEILRKHIERCINEAILERYKLFEQQNEYETVGKLLIRYIDRNIRSLFIDGLKKTRLVYQAEAAGISLVVPSVANNSHGQSDDSHSSIDEAEDEGDEEEDSSSDMDRPMENMYIEDTPMRVDNADPNTTKLPIDVILVWQNTSRVIASIAAVSLHISTNCSRCKAEESHEVSTTNNKPVQWRCIKCAMAQSMQLKGLLVHENSSVLCELDCRGCRPLDCILLQSHLIFTCLACNMEDNVQKLNYGQSHKSWCKGCHAPCEFSVAAIRFRGDFTRLTLEDKDAAKNLPKIKRKVESHAVVTPGAPLPDNGTCKHYKKSYRWFRFPCCGKVFPCDTCHELANLGHEMKLANRMICGHCSHEQPFQKSKPCTSCDQNVVRSRSQFWEGGKGCRDQNAMNRNDGRKFTNSRKKTVSKAKVGQLVVKTKKETP